VLDGHKMEGIIKVTRRGRQGRHLISLNPYACKLSGGRMDTCLPCLFYTANRITPRHPKPLFFLKMAQNRDLNKTGGTKTWN